MNVLERDFFTDPEIVRDPDSYYAALRELGPVWREPHHGVFMISGIEEILAVYADHASFSAVVAPLGPFMKLPEPDEGESLAEVIERRRHEIPLSDQLVTFDPPKHTRHRALLNKILTPNRLKETEEFMAGLADRLIDEFADRGEIEFCKAYANPFTLLVIADLLGVPREDHDTFRGWQRGVAGDTKGNQGGDQIFANLYPYFTRYIGDRRAAPRDDVMAQMASVRFPDGELPEVIDVVRIACLLFLAGQETTARLLGTGMRILAEQPSLADELRADPDGIPNFIEECLRLESPIKGPFRLALRDARLAGVEIPAGSLVMVMNGAANRDPRVFEDGDRFDAKRANVRRNIAFGHGEHFCPGASLARTEARVSFERLLARLDDLELVDPSALSYAPSFIIRGLNDLPLRFRRRS
jgi:cytochrome P450